MDEQHGGERTGPGGVTSSRPEAMNFAWLARADGARK
jgi:hypothetical protein